MQLFDSFTAHLAGAVLFSVSSPSAQLWSEERSLLPSVDTCLSRVSQFIPLFLSSILPVPGKFQTMSLVYNWNKSTCRIAEEDSKMVYLIFFCQLLWFKYCLSCCSFSFHQALSFFHIEWWKLFFLFVFSSPTLKKASFLLILFFSFVCVCVCVKNTGLYLLLALKDGCWIKA